MKLKDRLFRCLELVGAKLSTITGVLAIKDTFIELMPIIIGGSFATLLNNVLCSPKNGIAQFSGFEFLTTFTPIFSGINYATMNFLSVFIAFVVAIKYSKLKGFQNILMAGIVSLGCFITLLPTTAQGVSAAKEAVTISNVIAAKYTNVSGMFMALISGLVATRLYLALFDVKALKLKMPPSVPEGVAKSFEAVIPAMITFLIFGIFNFMFIKIVNQNIPDIIYSGFQQPMMLVMQTPLGFLGLCLFSGLLWVVGIHGQQMIKAVRDPLLLATLAANLEAFEAGEKLTNIVTLPFWNTYMTIGGSGNTLGLLIAIFLFSKRADYKQIAKLSAVPSCFGINEPMIFGMPIVMNPIMLIPFVMTPVVSGAIAYTGYKLGIASPAIVQVPFTVPPLLNAFLSTSGSMGAVMLQLICIIVSFLMYLPFVLYANKEAKQEESLIGG